eukprot:179002_1
MAATGIPRLFTSFRKGCAFISNSVKRHPTATICGTFLFGLTCMDPYVDQMYRQWNGVGIEEEFLTGFGYNPAQETNMATLKTGDVIFFRRKVNPFRPWRAILLVLSRSRSVCLYDHMAIIVRFDEDDTPYVLEAGLGGVRVTPYDERYITSLSINMGKRRLLGRTFTDEEHEALKQYISELQQHNARDGFWSLLYAGCRGLDPNGSMEKYVEITELINEKEHLQWRLQTDDSDLRPTTHAKILSQIEKHETLIRNLTEQVEDQQGSVLRPRMHAAELVASVYKFLGVLPPAVDPKCFAVSNFSTSFTREAEQQTRKYIPVGKLMTGDFQMDISWLEKK